MTFADTSFWVALENRRDDWHADAVRALRGGTEPIVTTNHVRGESWTLLRRRAGHGLALRFLDGLSRSHRVRIVFVTEAQEADAIQWLRRHDLRTYSFGDATSFEVMRTLRMQDALTFDAAFAAAGFRTIP